METRRIGIVMNGVTGRMGTNQHLVRSILAIIEQGGVQISPELRLMPDPILTGRNENKLKKLSDAYSPALVAKGALTKPLAYTTDVAAAINDPAYDIVFDASGTLQRARFVEMAVNAGKAVYCEKPTAVTTDEAVRLAQLCRDGGVKNGVVQDKLFLPGIRKLKTLIDQGFFGKILSVRGDFGYWVFTGEHADQPIQRPSWNYRAEDGGGIIIDMFCHWRYVIDHTFGPACGGGLASVIADANTDIPTRYDEQGKPYEATADDSAYAIFRMADGTPLQFNSSWCTRVRRDDLLTIQVDGTHGSAVAGLRECWIQPLAATPKPVWNPDIPQPINFYDNWMQLPNATHYDNGFKIQWELFLRHVALNEPYAWDLMEGAKGVQLAELGLQSWREGRRVQIPDLAATAAPPQRPEPAVA